MLVLGLKAGGALALVEDVGHELAAVRLGRHGAGPGPAGLLPLPVRAPMTSRTESTHPRIRPRGVPGLETLGRKGGGFPVPVAAPGRGEVFSSPGRPVGGARRTYGESETCHERRRSLSWPNDPMASTSDRSVLSFLLRPTRPTPTL